MTNPTPIKANGTLMLDTGDGSGTRIPFADNDPVRATYGLFITNYTPPATPTDILTIAPIATGKTVRMRSIMIAGTATSASNIIINLLRRSAVNTGGTAVGQSVAKRDILADNPTAVASLYTANATGLGTLAGTLDGGRLNIAPPANGGIDRLIFQYSWLNDQAIILRPSATPDVFALNLGGIAWPAGGALDMALSWTEE